MRTEKRRLPEGWKWVTLDKLIIEAQSGFACGDRDPDGVIQLRMNNVDVRGNFVWDEFIRVPASPETIARYKLEPDDVLFNNTNSTELVGKSALFTGYKESIVYSNHFTRLRTDKHLLAPMFLAAWINHQWIQGIFAEICNRWIGQSAVKPTKLLTLRVPLPPLSEQQRIAVILNEQMATVDAARKAAEARLEAVQSLPAAFLRQVFPSPDQKLSEGWKWVKLEEISYNIQYGFTASADFSTQSPKFLRITDIQDGKVDWTSVPGCDTSQPLDDYYLKNGDIVFARTGATTGKSYLIKDPPLSIFASYLIRIRPTENVTSDYLYQFFQSDIYWNQIRGGIRGGAQGGFNATMLSKLHIILPSLSKQKHIVAILNDQMTAIERARKAAEEELAAIKALPAALLRRAFAGEL